MMGCTAKRYGMLAAAILLLSACGTPDLDCARNNAVADGGVCTCPVGTVRSAGGRCVPDGLDAADAEAGIAGAVSAADAGAMDSSQPVADDGAIADGGLDVAVVRDSGGDAPDAPGPLVDGGELASVRTMKGGWAHTCATIGSALACFGDGQYGELGQGPSDTNSYTSPKLVPAIQDVIDVAVNGESTCIANRSAEVWCWGRNDYGQVGDSSLGNVLLPKRVSGLVGVQVTTGSNFACAITASRTVACWGGNSVGQLGNGLNNNSSSPVSVVGVQNAQSISAHSGHACAVADPGGAVKCWGWNSEGQLGNNTKLDSNLAVTVQALAGATQVAVGGRHSCALLASTSDVLCWGWNAHGQLGNSSIESSLTPVMVVGLAVDAVQITAGGGHTCALLKDKSVYCWGLNDQNQIGDGMTDDVLMPKKVSLAKSPVEVMAGDRHTCVRFEDETIACWGLNDHGQLGIGSAATPQASPQSIVSPG